MKITIGQVMAANEAMQHLNDSRQKPSLALTLALAANALQPFLAAHEKARSALMDECFDLSKAVQVGAQQQAPFRLQEDGSLDPAMPIKWFAGLLELSETEVEWTLGAIPASNLDTLEPPPTVGDMRALAWMLKEEKEK